MLSNSHHNDRTKLRCFLVPQISIIIFPCYDDISEEEERIISSNPWSISICNIIIYVTYDPEFLHLEMMHLLAFHKIYTIYLIQCSWVFHITYNEFISFIYKTDAIYLCLPVPSQLISPSFLPVCPCNLVFFFLWLLLYFNV